MKIEIEDYKGQVIVYNDDSDKFECAIEMNNQVRSTKRASLKDVRKEIDQFIKANLEFKPFKFLMKSKYSGDKSFSPYFCSAIRTDGKFVVNNNTYSSNSYLSEKEMAFAMVYDAEVVEDLAKIELEFEQARIKRTAAISELYDKLVPCDLSVYKYVTASDDE